MTKGATEGESFSPSIRSLAELFDKDSKRFEWMAKQYYDLFAYHAAQRLTAFNFFLVSLSFFSTAYATLIARSDPSGMKYYSVAGCLAFAAYLLVVAFARLDKRNEQIIAINEKPLIRIQRAIRLGLSGDNETGDEVWETFVQAERSYPYRSFGDILPIIYSLAAAACAAGAMYGFSGPGEGLHPKLFPLWILLTILAIVLIRWPLWWARTGEEALREADKVVRGPGTSSAERTALARDQTHRQPNAEGTATAPLAAGAIATQGDPAKTRASRSRADKSDAARKTPTPGAQKLPKS